MTLLTIQTDSRKARGDAKQKQKQKQNLNCGRKVWGEFKSRGSKEPLYFMQSRKFKEDLKGESGLGPSVVKWVKKFTERGGSRIDCNFTKERRRE